MDNKSTVGQKFTKIHLVKMVRCITGLSLKECVEITDRHLAIEDLKLTFDNPVVITGRKEIQDDLLNKMINTQVRNEIDKEIERLQKIRSEIYGND